jgi:hypothetical protein
MTGLNDDLLDGDQECVITFDVSAVESGEAYYNNVAWSFRVVNLDDDKLLADLGLVFDTDGGQRKLGDDVSRRLGTTVQSCSTSEAGGTCTYNFPVNAFMSSWLNMIVTFESEDTTEGTIATAQQSVTFTAIGSEDIVVTGVDDDVDDDDQTYLVKYIVTINCKPSAGNCLNGNTVASYTFSANYLQYINTDDDSAGIDVTQVTPWTGQTSEAGQSASYDVKLTSEPVNGVTVSVVSLDTTEGNPDKAALTFTASNWNTAQRVAIVGQDDDVYDETIAYQVMVGPATSDDAKYANQFSSTYDLQNADDDMYSLHVEWVDKGNTSNQENAKTSELGQTTTYKVRLGSEPKKSTVITAFSKDGSEAEVTPSIIVLAADNWKEGKEITVTGKPDNEADGNVQYLLEVTPIIGDTEYGDSSKVPASNVQITNYEDPVELLNITFNTTTCALKESGTNCVLEFKLANWYTASSYPFTNKFYKVKLTARTGDATEAQLLVNGMPKDSTELYFSETNWNAPSFLTILAVDDFLVDGTKTFAVNLEAEIYSVGRSNEMVAQAGAQAKMPAAITCTNADDDVAELLLVPSGGTACTKTSESDVVGNRGCTWAVSLKSQPQAGSDVVVAVVTNDTALGEATTPANGQLTFTTSNWMTPQELKVQGTEDVCGIAGSPCYSGGAGTYEPYSITWSATSTDTNWQTMTNVVMNMQNEDNDNIALDIRQGGVLVKGGLTPVDEMGTGSTFTVSLQTNTQPTAAVTVSMSVSDGTEIGLSTYQLIFNADASFSAPQSVTVTGKDDQEADGDVTVDVSFLMSSSDADYPPAKPLEPIKVSIINYDDDMLVLINSTGTTTEAGGAFTFQIKMRDWRDSFEHFNVLVARDVGPHFNDRIGTTAQRHTKEGKVTSSDGSLSMLWTRSNWNTTKYITVTGVDDNLDDGDQTYTINLTPLLKVSGLGAKTVATMPLTVTNIDDDVSGIDVIQISNTTSENGGPWPGASGAGGTATFTVRPTSEPFEDMKIEVACTDLTEATLSTSSLWFTPADWNVPKTITATGVDDFVYDYPQNFKVNINSALTSSDLNYRGQQATSLNFVNNDDDHIGLVVSKVVTKINGTTSENKLFTAKIFIHITSQPKDTVLFTVMSDDPTEATTNPNIIAFSDTTWMVPQEVTVVGVDDPSLDGDMQYSVVVKTMYTQDPDYGSKEKGLFTETRQFINMDDATDVAITECPLGMYGTILPATGQLDCAACPAGQYSDTTKNVTTLSNCKSCYYGTYSAAARATAMSQCLPCPAGQFNNELSQTACQPCDNSTYCGIGTIVPLVGVDVLQLSTVYQHGWQLVSASSFVFNFTWWDPQYMRQDKVVTQNSVQMLWFGLCAGLAFAVCVALYFISSRNSWVHNYVRSLDIFNDEHYEDPRPEEADSEDEEEDGEDEDDEWGNTDEDGSDDEENEKLRRRRVRHKKRLFVNALKVSGAGTKEVNGIYKRVIGSEGEGCDPGAPRFVKSAEQTDLYTKSPIEGDFVTQRYTIDGVR